MSRAGAIIATTVLAGSAAWQAPMNARLGGSIGPLPASVVSFVVSVLFLAAIAIAVGGARSLLALPALLRGARLRDLTGGLIGASYVVVAVLTVGSLGTGGLIAGSVAGTLIGAVGIDWVGLVGVERRVPGGVRLLGVPLLIGGTVVLGGGLGRGFAPVSLAAIFAVGVLVAFQPPVNARLALRLGGARAALTQSSIGLCALLLVTLASGTASAGGDGSAIPWWAWGGGLLGACYVVSTLVSVPVIGAGGVAAASIAGGLAFGVVADAAGMFGLDRVPFTPVTFLGLVLLALGAALVLRRQGTLP